MIKKILGIAPKLRDDGSYSPSKVALKLAVAAKTDYTKVSYEKYQGQKSKILVICTEQKDMQMKNGKKFSIIFAILFLHSYLLTSFILHSLSVIFIIVHNGADWMIASSSSFTYTRSQLVM